VPDQRYYTKTNFFTITNNDNNGDMSVADKYANMNSQKNSRRSHHRGANNAFDSNSKDFTSGDEHLRMQSFNTDGGALSSSKQGFDSEYFQAKNRGGVKNKFVLKPIDEMQQQQQLLAQMSPSDFDSSGMLAKRKIKRKNAAAAYMNA
jgi:hypothetical protein